MIQYSFNLPQTSFTAILILTYINMTYMIYTNKLSFLLNVEFLTSQNSILNDPHITHFTKID